jgi:GntR family transcriptional repressor for pyruvate dehydrogenase complex
VIREALSTVAALDILEAQTGRGTYVTSLPRDYPLAVEGNRLQDIVNVREILETGALLLASRTSSDGARRIVQNALDDLRAAMQGKSGTHDVDVAFHAAIIMAAESPLLMRIWESIEHSVADTIHVSPHGRLMTNDIFRAHEVLARGALGEGAVDAAISASRELHQEHREFLLRLLG